jgi:hypothetical protein
MKIADKKVLGALLAVLAIGGGTALAQDRDDRS